ncbi:hypothetical protein YC2023_017009 [Brassica napus]
MTNKRCETCIIGRLTVSELEESNWVYRKTSKLEDLEGIITEDIASNILDQLLEETITTFSLTSQVSTSGSVREQRTHGLTIT